MKKKLTTLQVQQRNREHSRIWRKKNPEKYLAGILKWRKENPERDKELSRRASAAWKKRNPKHAIIYYRRNRKRLLKQNSEYVKAHPEWNVAKKHKRRSLEKQNGGNYTAQQWIDLKLFYGRKCLRCRRRERTLAYLGLRLVPDHVISISRGGSNAISNIQPLCHGKGGCNNKKGSKCADYRPADYILRSTK